MQPTFNPWMGYFDLIDYVDKFIFLDTVQLNKQSWQTRNKIKISEREMMFSIPIQKTQSKKNMLINEALIDFRKYDFRIKLSKTLEQNYKKSRFFGEVNPFIQEIIFFETPYLSQYNIHIIQNILTKLDIDTKIITLSQTEFHTQAKKAELVLNVSLFFDANIYVTPLGAKNYLKEYNKNFHDKNIEIFYQYYKHPIYRQEGKNFMPYIGIFDLLYNEGFEKSLDIIRSGRVYQS